MKNLSHDLVENFLDEVDITPTPQGRLKPPGKRKRKPASNRVKHGPQVVKAMASDIAQLRAQVRSLEDENRRLRVALGLNNG